jgi:vacuolar iron transporter family protein
VALKIRKESGVGPDKDRKISHFRHFLAIRQARKKLEPEQVDAAAEAHEQDRIEQSAQYGSDFKSEYLGSIVYGGLDGIITTFAIVSGVMGAQLAPEIIMILGVANLLGDGFSMAAGAYLSAKSEQEVHVSERRQMAGRIAQAPDIQVDDLYELYCRQGYSESEALRLTEIKSRNPGRWVNTMLAEKHLRLPQKEKPILNGVFTFIAFVIFGAVPLSIFMVDLVVDLGITAYDAFLLSIAFTGVALMLLGAAKIFVTGRSPLRSGLEMLMVGGLAAAVAYAVGALLKNLV